jgi:hypothetical protein
MDFWRFVWNAQVAGRDPRGAVHDRHEPRGLLDARELPLRDADHDRPAARAESFVPSSSSMTIEDRLDRIRQQVLSRTRLERCHR